jgi:hypothetical protein
MTGIWGRRGARSSSESVWVGRSWRDNRASRQVLDALSQCSHAIAMAIGLMVLFAANSASAQISQNVTLSRSDFSAAGQMVTFTSMVTNNFMPSPINNLDVTLALYDDATLVAAANFTCGTTVLASFTNTTCSVTYSITAADIARGRSLSYAVTAGDQVGCCVLANANTVSGPLTCPP